MVAGATKPASRTGGTHPFVLLTLPQIPANTAVMARYFALLRRRIEVQYRAGDIVLPATGTLVADSGKSIFLEEHFQQHGRLKTFRWEIPYQYIVRLAESTAPLPSPTAASPADAPSEQPSPLPLKDRPGEA